MNKLTVKQQSALAWFVEMNNLIPQMSVHPVYQFIHRETREPQESHIISIVTQYEGRER